MDISKAVLGERAIYPGHPLTIAYIIVSKYDSLEQAREKGSRFPRALEDTDIRVLEGTSTTRWTCSVGWMRVWTSRTLEQSRTTDGR